MKTSRLLKQITSACLCTILVFSLMTIAFANYQVVAFAEEEKKNAFVEEIPSEQSFVDLDEEKQKISDIEFDDVSPKETMESSFLEEPYGVADTIRILFKIDTARTVSDVNYNFEGFEMKGFSFVNKDVIEFLLSIKENDDQYFLNVIVAIEEKILVASVYGYKTPVGFFLSRSSKDSPIDIAENYICRGNNIESNGVHEISTETNSTCSIDIEEIVFNSPQKTTKGSSTTYVNGRWRWYDGNFYHPLKYTLVNLYSNNSLVDSTYTDDEGYYSFSFNQTSTTHCYVQVRTEGKNVKVRKNTFYQSYYCNTPMKDISPGENASFYYYLDTPTATSLKAFQVVQALIIGSRYVTAMTGEAAPYATCHFPKDNDQYSSFWNVIDITEDAYRFWDIILHEYGHRLQDHYNITNNPGGSHIITEDLIARYGKQKGIRMAWGEGWPTFFAILVTQYYGSSLQNIAFINDNTYDSYSYNSSGSLYPWSVNLESEYISSSNSGEGCEASVFKTLYDLYDPAGLETWDQVSFSHRTMFNAVINSNAKTFSDFINYFTNNYLSESDGRIGNILTNNHISSENLRVYGGSLSSLNAPEFKWDAGGSNSNTMNSFSLWFYDSSNNIILSTARQTSTTLKISDDQWAKVLSASGTTFKVSVQAFQTSSPSTGGYFSSQITLTKPEIINPQYAETFQTSTRYLEKKITLARGQYYEYAITFKSSGSKTFQTFGSKDAVLELYSQSGNLLVRNDDEGYNLNALICYYTLADTTYIVRVRLFASYYGTTKLAITPAYGATNEEVNSLTKYEDIYSIKNYTKFTWNSFAEQKYTRMVTFTAPSAGKYTFELNSDFDNYIYVIDPRVAEKVVFNIDYNDDGGEGYNAKLKKELSANVPYLVIYSAYNPGNSTTTGDLVLKIKK